MEKESEHELPRGKKRKLKEKNFRRLKRLCNSKDFPKAAVNKRLRCVWSGSGICSERLIKDNGPSHSQVEAGPSETKKEPANECSSSSSSEERVTADKAESNRPGFLQKLCSNTHLAKDEDDGSESFIRVVSATGEPANVLAGTEPSKINKEPANDSPSLGSSKIQITADKVSLNAHLDKDVDVGGDSFGRVVSAIRQQETTLRCHSEYLPKAGVNKRLRRSRSEETISKRFKKDCGHSESQIDAGLSKTKKEQVTESPLPDSSEVEAGPCKTKKETVITSLSYNSNRVQVTADKAESIRPGFLQKLSSKGSGSSGAREHDLSRGKKRKLKQKKLSGLKKHCRSEDLPKAAVIKRLRRVWSESGICSKRLTKDRVPLHSQVETRPSKTKKEPVNKSSSFGSSEERVTVNKAETSQPVFLQKLGPSVHLAKNVDDGSEYFGRIATAASGESANVLIGAGPSKSNKEPVNDFLSLSLGLSEIQIPAAKVSSNAHLVKNVDVGGDTFGRVVSATQQPDTAPVEAGPSETKKESINTSLLYSSSEVQVTADKVESFRPNFLKKLSLNAHFDKYVLGDMIGSGSFGRVFSGIRKSDNAPVAIKFVERVKVREFKEMEGIRIPAEAYLQHKARHQYVIEIYEVFSTEDYYVIVMERPEQCQDLFDVLQTKVVLNEKEARKYFSQVVEANISCEEHGVIHRDLKPENILLDLLKDEIKLIDFGLASEVQEEPFDTFRGTTAYKPPESITAGRYDGCQGTVWQLGILLVEILSEDMAFEKPEDALNFKPRIPEYVSPEAADLIRMLLNPAPSNRPRLREVLQHPWFSLQD